MRAARRFVLALLAGMLVLGTAACTREEQEAILDEVIDFANSCKENIEEVAGDAADTLVDGADALIQSLDGIDLSEGKHAVEAVVDDLAELLQAAKEQLEGEG